MAADVTRDPQDEYDDAFTAELGAIAKERETH